MAPIKFEENIKEKLEQRAIKPTGEAWNKLADKLDAHEVKTSRKSYWWLGIAASVVAIIMIFNSGVNTNVIENGITPIQVASEPDTNVQKESQNIESNTELLENTKVTENTNTPVLITESDVQTKPKAQQQIAEVKTDKNTKQDELNTLQNTNVASVVEEGNQNDVIDSEKAYAFVEGNIETNIADNLDTEIEVLLSKAKHDVIKKTATNNEESKINANSLLEEVEFDLDQSFRDKVFEKLKVSYKKVSTAVANRND